MRTGLPPDMVRFCTSGAGQAPLVAVGPLGLGSFAKPLVGVEFKIAPSGFLTLKTDIAGFDDAVSEISTAIQHLEKMCVNLPCLDGLNRRSGLNSILLSFYNQGSA